MELMLNGVKGAFKFDLKKFRKFKCLCHGDSNPKLPPSPLLSVAAAKIGNLKLISKFRLKFKTKPDKLKYCTV